MSEKVKSGYKKFWRGKTITIISLVCFLLALIIIMASNRYMNSCIENEITAQRNRTELRQLGESLSEASDYLTDEARKYVITGDIKHLYNYWKDVLEVETRDKIINTLEGCNPPDSERKLLEQAKKYSDILINTETRSMKLMLLSQGKQPEDFKTKGQIYGYVERVMKYDLSEEDKKLKADELSEKAREILYNEKYGRYKDLINSPINDFKERLNQRLDKTAEKSKEGIRTASFIQIAGSAAVLIFIGALCIMINFLYTKPLNDCTEELNILYGKGIEGKTLTKVRVKPRGAYELKKLATIFNKLSAVLCNELETRKLAEKAMREARDEADKANNAKSDFLARMSHELRTPLNAIIGYLYLLKKKSRDEQEQDYINKIYLSAENLLGLINDILDFSKIESGNMKFEEIDFNLRKLISEVCEMEENDITKKHLNFITHISEGLPEIVVGDPLRLRQVLINLLGNAQKFTQKGEVKLIVQVEKKEEDKEIIRFSVEDTGIGIKKEDQKKILEPFVQSDAGISRKYGGTGLGTSISNMIVEEASNGKYHLELESEYRKGSRFSFLMEFLQGNPENVEAAGEEEENFEIQGEKKVLLIDDNEINLEMESEILRSFGVKVDKADSGKKAIELTKNKMYQMILIDIQMPDMNGYECAKRIRQLEKYRYVPMIALSADVVTGVSKKAVEAGMNDYLSKPLKPQKLYEVMEKYFQMAIQAPEEIATDRTKYFDYEGCLYNLGGNKKTLCRLIKRFLSTQKNNREYIKQHVKNKDYAIACAMLHDVIGSSGNLGCNRLSEAARELKAHLHNNKEDGLDEFFRIWEQTNRELEDYLENQSEEKKEENSKDYRKLAEKIYELSQDFDIAVMEIFEDNRDFIKKNIEKNDFQKLEEAVGKYDFESICEILGNLQK